MTVFYVMFRDLCRCILKTEISTLLTVFRIFIQCSAESAIAELPSSGPYTELGHQDRYVSWSHCSLVLTVCFSSLLSWNVNHYHSLRCHVEQVFFTDLCTWQSWSLNIVLKQLPFPCCSFVSTDQTSFFLVLTPVRLWYVSDLCRVLLNCSYQ